MAYSIKGFSGGLATLVVGGISVTAFNTFVKGIFTRAFTEYNTMDLILAISIILFGVSLILIGKDVIDGGNWTKSEKEKAIKGLAITLILVGGAYASSTLMTGYTLVDPIQDQFQDTATYTGGAGSVASTVVVSEQYVALAGSTANDHTGLQIKLNQTGFTEAFIRNFRGFNFTIDDIGITSVILKFFNAEAASYTPLLSSVDGDITITTNTASTDVNVTLALSDVLGWVASYPYDEATDKYIFYIAFDTDYTENSDRVYTWKWLTSADTDAVYYLILFVMAIGLAAPFFIMLDLTNAKSDRSPPRRKNRRGRK